MSAEPRRCAGVNQRGEACKMPPLGSSAFCWSHDPEREGDRRAARQLGGARRKRGLGHGPVRLRDVPQIRAVLERVTGEVLGLDNGLPRTKGLSLMLNLAWRLVEGSEIEARLDRIEKALDLADSFNPDRTF